MLRSSGTSALGEESQLQVLGFMKEIQLNLYKVLYILDNPLPSAKSFSKSSHLIHFSFPLGYFPSCGSEDQRS